MTLLLNVTDAVSPTPNFGIARTERELARALAHAENVRFVAMRNGRVWEVAGPDVAAAIAWSGPARLPHVEVLGVDAPPPPTKGRRAAVRRAMKRARTWRALAPAPVPVAKLGVEPGDVLVSVGLDWVHGLVPEAERLVLGHGARYVAFCHDMIPVDHPEWLFPPDPEGFRDHFRRVAALADVVLCNSHHTRGDLLRHHPDLAPDRARVVTLGADLSAEPSSSHHAFAARLFDGEPYAVYCATVDRRKNHQLLYRAARELARRGTPANFAFVGGLGNGVDDLMDCLRHDRQVRGRFAHVTHCDDAHLAAIYARARFAVYPSLYEGWGLGVTEALAHGKPCLVASGSSLGEAGLGVCAELHPLRTADWVAALTEYFAAPPPLPPVDIPTWASTAAALVRAVEV